MSENFDIFSNLPWLILAFCFLVIFILFFWSFIALLRTRDIPEKVERGREILFTAISGFFITLVIALIFLLVTFLLREGEVLKPQLVSGEFPGSQAINFPPSPQFIKISQYYFNGPGLLKDSKAASESFIYSILCKQNDQYDILYINGGGRRTQFLKNPQYSCWLGKCNRNLKNLYIAFLATTEDKYGKISKDELIQKLVSELNPPCKESQ